LEIQRIGLDGLADQLGDYWYESLGVVTTVEIYWTAERWDGAGY